MWFIGPRIFRKDNFIEIGTKSGVFYFLELHFPKAVAENVHSVFGLQIIQQFHRSVNQFCFSCGAIQKIIAQRFGIFRIVNPKLPHRH